MRHGFLDSEKIVSEYDQEIPQSQTADNPVAQNIEQLQTPTMGVTINKKSTTTEPPP